jgi:hypothetical protein
VIEILDHPGDLLARIVQASELAHHERVFGAAFRQFVGAFDQSSGGVFDKPDPQAR